MVKLNYKYRKAVDLIVKQLNSYTQGQGNLWKHYHIAFEQMGVIVEIILADDEADVRDLKIVQTLRGKILNKGLEL